MATLLPEGKQSFANSAGAPLVGGKIYTYNAGTSTPRPTYQDAAATVPNTNPVILDARGEALVFWSGAYKVVLKDAADVTVWTVDNVVDSARQAIDLTNTLRAELFASSGASLVGFLPLGAGAVPSTVQTELRRWAFAEQFGAVGNGIADDTAAINNGVAYLASIKGGDLLFKSKVYGIAGTVTVTSSAVGLVGDGAEAYITGDFGTTFKRIGTSNTPMVVYDRVDAPKFKGIAVDCSNVANVGVRAIGTKLGQFVGFTIKDFTAVGFYGLCGSVAGEWASGNLVQNFLITSTNNGVDGLLLDGDAASNNDWFNNTFQNGLIQVNKTTLESHAGNLGFCDSNSFHEVDFTIGTGTGTAKGVLFNAGTRTLFPQNNNFYGCSVHTAVVNEPGANRIGKNFMFLFPTKDGETIPAHPQLLGMTDDGQYFGQVFEVKRDGSRLRLSPYSADRSYDILANANDVTDAGLQIIRRVAGVDTVIFQIDQNGDSYVRITGVGLRQVLAGAADSAGAGFKTLRVAN